MSQFITGESGQSAAKVNHSLLIDRRRHSVITGVTDVCSFHENEIMLKIDSGMMIITGQSLHIAKLLLEEGKLEVDGHIDGVLYEAPKKALRFAFPWKRRKA